MEKKENKTTEQTTSEQTTFEKTTSEQTVAKPTVEQIATLALQMAYSNLNATCEGCALFPRCAFDAAQKRTYPQRVFHGCVEKIVKYAKEIYKDAIEGDGVSKAVAEEIIKETAKIDFSFGGSDNAED